MGGGLSERNRHYRIPPSLSWLDVALLLTIMRSGYERILRDPKLHAGKKTL